MPWGWSALNYAGWEACLFSWMQSMKLMYNQDPPISIKPKNHPLPTCVACSVVKKEHYPSIVACAVSVRNKNSQFLPSLRLPYLLPSHAFSWMQWKIFDSLSRYPKNLPLPWCVNLIRLGVRGWGPTPRSLLLHEIIHVLPVYRLATTWACWTLWRNRAMPGSICRVYVAIASPSSSQHPPDWHG